MYRSVRRAALSSKTSLGSSITSQRRWASQKPWFSNYLVSPKEFSQAYLQFHAYKGISGSLSLISPLCASWFLPNDPQKRTGRAEFDKIRIPRARFFDLDVLSDRRSAYPHMQPTTTFLRHGLERLGIREDHTIVVYDSHELGLFSAPRVAWTLRQAGYGNVHVLNNFKLYVEMGYPIETDEFNAETLPKRDKSAPKPSLINTPSGIVDFDHMKGLFGNTSNGESPTTPPATILDARSKGRFDGTDAEPRPGLSSGHMPHAINLPFTDVLDPETKTLLPPERLKAIFDRLSISSEHPVVSTCGTGVTAAIIELALQEAGYPEASRKLYDGSWTEWAQRVDQDSGLIVKSAETTD